MTSDASWTVLVEIKDAGLYLMKSDLSSPDKGEQAILVSIYTRMLLLLTHHLFTVLSVPFTDLLDKLLQKTPPIDFTAAVDSVKHAQEYGCRLDFLRLLLPEKRVMDDAECISYVQDLIPRLTHVLDRIPHGTPLSNDDWILLRRDADIVLMEMVMSDLIREFPCLGTDDIEAGTTGGNTRCFRLFRDEEENKDLFDEDGSDEEMSDAETDSTLHVSPILVDDKQLFEEEDDTDMELCKTPTCARFMVEPVVLRKILPSGGSLDLPSRMLIVKLGRFLATGSMV